MVPTGIFNFLFLSLSQPLSIVWYEKLTFLKCARPTHYKFPFQSACQHKPPLNRNSETISGYYPHTWGVKTEKLGDMLKVTLPGFKSKCSDHRYTQNWKTQKPIPVAMWFALMNLVGHSSPLKQQASPEMQWSAVTHSCDSASLHLSTCWLCSPSITATTLAVPHLKNSQKVRIHYSW